jgi:hypothetical protein
MLGGKYENAHDWFHVASLHGMTCAESFSPVSAIGTLWRTKQQRLWRSTSRDRLFLICCPNLFVGYWSDAQATVESLRGRLVSHQRCDAARQRRRPPVRIPQKGHHHSRRCQHLAAEIKQAPAGCSSWCGRQCAQMPAMLPPN